MVFVDGWLVFIADGWLVFVDGWLVFVADGWLVFVDELLDFIADGLMVFVGGFLLMNGKIEKSNLVLIFLSSVFPVFLFNKYAPSIGVTVRATRVENMVETATVTPNGWKN